jgi:crossover junction endodeoxyribonuclease RuvC
MRVIGIDPGTAIVGYGVLDYKSGRYTVVDYGCIYTETGLQLSKRLKKIYDDLYVLLEKYKPDHMAVEELYYFKNNKTVISVGQARGVIVLCGEKLGVKIGDYTPLQVKMGITGYGRATKSQVQTMVKNVLNMESIPKPDDAADALAIAVTHINTLLGGGVKDKSLDIKEVNSIGKGKISAKEFRKLLNIK